MKLKCYDVVRRSVKCACLSLLAMAGVAVQGNVAMAVAYGEGAAAHAHGEGAAGMNYDAEWKAVRKFERKGEVRSAAAALGKIEAKAIEDGKWPEAIAAFTDRFRNERAYTEEWKENWIPELERRMAAEPPEMRVFLDLVLAHVYIENSEEGRLWGGGRTRLTDDAADKANLPAWAPEKLPASVAAMLERIFAEADFLKREKASDWKRLFKTGNMPEKCRPTLYDIFVHEVIGFYGSTIPDGSQEKGLALLDSLIAFHENDVDAKADAELERIRYRDMKDDERKKAYDDFIAAYFEKSELSALAAHYRVSDFDDDKPGWRIELAERAADRWPKTVGAKLCRAFVDRLKAGVLRSVEVENVWCAPWPKIEVEAKNLTGLSFRLVKVDPQERLAADWNLRTKMKELRKRQAVREWSVKVEDAGDYEFHRHEYEVPRDLAKGCYLLMASEDASFAGDSTPIYARMVTVSDLALVISSGNGEIRGSVHLADEGASVEGAEVRFWSASRSDQKTEPLASLRTGKSGEFICSNFGDNRSIMVEAVLGEDRIFSLDSEWCGRLSSNEENPLRLSLQTDRSLYRPGQRIQLKGFLSYVDRGKRDFHVVENAAVLVKLKDRNGKLVKEMTVRSNAWGSFVCEFDAPTDRLTGTYSIEASVLKDKDCRFTATVKIEEYKRPKFSVSLGEAPSDAILGRAVKLVGEAKTFSGLPVANAKVSWGATREARFASWFRCPFETFDDEIVSGTAVTDENGKFEIVFVPEPSAKVGREGEPSFRFGVSAEVTDSSGETRTAFSSFEIGYVAWRAEVQTEDWHTDGKSAAVSVSLHSLDFTKVESAEGTIRVSRLVGPEKPVRKPVKEPRWSYRYLPEEDGGDKPGLWNLDAWQVGEFVTSNAVRIADGKWSGSFDLAPGAYLVEFSAVDKSGNAVTARTRTVVSDGATEGLGVALPSMFKVDTGKSGVMKPGDKVRFLWASGYEKGAAKMEILSNGKLVRACLNDFNAPKLDEEYTVQEADRGEIECRVLFVRENRMYFHWRKITVGWDNMKLEVKAEHFNSKLTGGSGKEKWSFKVTGPSEVLAFMYDKALDEYDYHWLRNPFGDFSPRVNARFNPSLQCRSAALGQIAGRYVSPPGAPSPEWTRIDPKYLGMDPFTGNRMMGRMKLCANAPAMVEDAVPARAMCEASAPMTDSVADNSSVGYYERMESCAEEKEAPEKNEKAEPVKVRKNLQETAFFHPQILTDKDGRFTLSFDVPEALTGWKLCLLAHDKSLRSGMLVDESITTTKPLMVEPNAPRFVREGDDFYFAVKVTNTSEKDQKCRVMLEFEDAASGEEAPVVRDAAKEVALKAGESRSVEFRVVIPDGQGFLKYTAKAVGDDFSDGEEGYLATLSRRIEVREAVQLNLRGAGEKRFALSNLVATAEEGTTVKNVALTARVVSRPAWYAVAALPYLMEFPHECCEQTFSRYYANALAGYIANSDKRIREVFDAWAAEGADALKSPLELNSELKSIALEATPWVEDAEDETAAKRRLGTLFAPERLESEQRRCLAKLEESITCDGLFPWFPGGYGSVGISTYILTGAVRLERLAGGGKPRFFGRVLEAVDREMEENIAERLKPEHLPFSINTFDLRWMYLHSFDGVKAMKAKTARLLLDELKGKWTDFDLEAQALGAIVLDRSGEKETAKEILKSIRERAVESEEFGLYWKTGTFFSSNIFAAPVSRQATIIEAFREVAGDMETVDLCRVWLLKQKQTQNWRSTAATADAVYALLVGGGTDLLAGDTLATVTLGGVETPKTNAEKGTGTYSASWRGDEVKPEMGEIVLKSDVPGAVVWGGVNWVYLEDVMKVKKNEPEELRIEKFWFRKIRTAEGERLAPLEGTLEQGDEIVSRLKIRCDRTLEYVHIRDERPTCAEPVDVISGYRWQDGAGYYQSTRDTATHYYLDRLNRGEFVLETSYRVQQRGVFSGGLASIECMYAPEFGAHSTAERVEVSRR